MYIVYVKSPRKELIHSEDVKHGNRESPSFGAKTHRRTHMGHFLQTDVDPKHKDKPDSNTCHSTCRDYSGFIVYMNRICRNHVWR
jgi:hypothetical protein